MVEIEPTYRQPPTLLFDPQSIPCLTEAVKLNSTLPAKPWISTLVGRSGSNISGNWGSSTDITAGLPSTDLKFRDRRRNATYALESTSERNKGRQ